MKRFEDENTQSRILIFKNKPSLFQYVYLLGEGDRLLVYSIYKRNVPPWSAGLATRSVVGFVDAKVMLFIESTKLLDGKLFFDCRLY